MDVLTEWSRVLRLLSLTEEHWLENILPRGRAQNAIDVCEMNIINSWLDIVKEYVETRPHTMEVLVDIHTCLQHVNNVLRDIALRLGLPIHTVHSSQI
jgi:hypothetical protein